MKQPFEPVSLTLGTSQELGKTLSNFPKVGRVSFDQAQISAVPKAKISIGDSTNVYELNINETVNIINIGRGLKTTHNLTNRQTEIMTKLKKQQKQMQILRGYQMPAPESQSIQQQLAQEKDEIISI